MNFNINYKIIELNIIKIFFFYIFIILIILSSYKKIKRNKNIIKIKKKKLIKICLCAVGKQENKYIREFVDYYKKFGVDKIYIYDNNNIKGEKFNNILSDYIIEKYVQIINYRGKLYSQFEMYQNCYKKNSKSYDWMIFYDIDEYIYLKNYINIKDFLNEKKFKKCESIYLNWKLHSDNDLLYYTNKSLHKRFPKTYFKKRHCIGKTIIRGNIKNIKIKSCHLLDLMINRCNGFGKIFKPRGNNCKIPDYNYYYIDHYQFKSTEEFVNKINKGDCVNGYKIKYKLKKIMIYFIVNKMTEKKIKYIESKTGLSLSNIIKYLKTRLKKKLYYSK